MFAHLFFHCPDLLNHALDQYQQAEIGASTSLLWPIKLQHVLPALCFSTDSQFFKRDRFSVVKHFDITVSLPWLMAFTSAVATRRRTTTGGVSVERIYGKAVPHTLLEERPAPANEEMHATVRANLSARDKLGFLRPLLRRP